MPFYAHIDWTRPWYASILPAAKKISAAPDWRAVLNQTAQAMNLRNHRDLPLQFIAQEELPQGVAYESHISDQGKVPTRENLHDFFNALVWLSFPKIKRQLNALQAAQIAQLGIGKSRGPARDAATIFDENAAILVLENADVGRQLLAHLKAHEWQQALYDMSACFGKQAQVWSFGHALMEKLVTPYKAITAHTWVMWANSEFFMKSHTEQAAWIDQTVSTALQTHPLSTADYTPLPVAGIPAWHAQQSREFYLDTQVFRPKRSN